MAAGASTAHEPSNELPVIVSPSSCEQVLCLELENQPHSFKSFPGTLGSVTPELPMCPHPSMALDVSKVYGLRVEPPNIASRRVVQELYGVFSFRVIVFEGKLNI
jgi:hypothetical protein